MRETFINELYSDLYMHNNLANLDAVVHYAKMQMTPEWKESIAIALRSIESKEQRDCIPRALDNVIYFALADDYRDPKDYGNAAMLSLKGYDAEQIADAIGHSAEWAEDFRNVTGFSNIDIDVDNLVRKESPLQDRIVQTPKGEKVIVTMGTTPSGELTLANAYTLASGVSRVNELCAKYGVIPEFSLGVNDYAIRRGQEKFLDERLGILETFLGDMKDAIGVDMPIKLFSDIQCEKSFREMLDYLRENKLISDRADDLDIRRAKRGSREFSTFNVENADFHDPDFIYSGDIVTHMVMRMHYSNSDVHIMGGDQEHADFLFSEKRFPGKDVPTPYMPGVVYGLNGVEMHVSKGNAIKYSELREKGNPVSGLIDLSKRPSDTIGPADYWNMLSPDQKQKAYRSSAKPEFVLKTFFNMRKCKGNACYSPMFARPV